MKKYKTWEVVKMLTETNNLIFKTVDNYRLSSNKYGLLKAYSNTGKEIEWSGNINLEDAWTLVQEPVSFIEAVKSTKAVRVEHEFITKLEPSSSDKRFFNDLINGKFFDIDNLIYNVSEYADAEPLRDILLNGKWYVEED
ncbi:MAG: hypothetical protein K0S61_715 [Anaerocolumna sp.]|jgi:hypothetical protein|nr:hypothetical protein [Anaerocolumna sp.]